MPNHNGKTYIALGRDLGANESLDKNAFNRKFSYKCFQVVKLFYLNGIKVSLFTLEKFTDFLQLYNLLGSVFFSLQVSMWLFSVFLCPTLLYTRQDPGPFHRYSLNIWYELITNWYIEYKIVNTDKLFWNNQKAKKKNIKNVSLTLDALLICLSTVILYICLKILCTTCPNI